MNDLVSVIIPVYNIEHFIERCINSVIHQTYKNLEIILVDDGSKDNSGKICDNYSEEDNRIKIVHKDNGGLSSARNAGLEISRGDFITFIDGDDWIDKDYISKCMERLLESKVDVLITPYIREYADKSVPNELFSGNYYVMDSELVTEKIFRRFFGLYKNELKDASKIDDLSTAWGKVYKREFCKNVRFVDTKIIGTEDAWYNINVFYNVKSVLYYGDVYYHYNKENQGSLIRSYNTDLFFGWKNLYQYMNNFVISKKLQEDFFEALNNRIVVDLFALCRNVINSNLSIKEKRNEIKHILDDKIYKKAFEKFDFSYLDLKWRWFYTFCRVKSFYGIYMMMIFAERLKKVLK